MALRADAADVCMILEGSYPYARGGVSIWADGLIRRLPELSFHLWCLVARREDLTPVYSLPPNVRGVTDVVLFEAPGEDPVHRPLPAGFWELVRELHRNRGDVAARADLLWGRLMRLLPPEAGPLPTRRLLLGPEAYRLLLDMYVERDEPLSFIDYFYTYLFTHLPLLKLMAAPVPPARLYHAISTGYAGLLGCKAKRLASAPLLLTEHGIYTNERQVEISLADWIYSRRERRIQVGRGSTTLKRIWSQMFDFLGRLTYQESDRITTLFGGNRDMEVRLGASPEKIEIIPNGVDLARFGALPRRTEPGQPRVGLVGRVVPIKDIRTFIKACRVVADRLPETRFLVLGSTEQTPAYYEKCLEYRKLMGLEGRLEFTGNVNVESHYPRLDVVVLTSVSEALPLTVLESMACGIPVVSTRVGACEELLLGRDEDDRAIGPCGVIATVGNHQEVGDAIVRILTEPGLAGRFAGAGRERARRHYDLATIERRYGGLYRRWLDAAGGPAAGSR
jgi:glycosyltransferase involved in cell wall biosynthesis